jgi:hypothetical protein
MKINIKFFDNFYVKTIIGAILTGIVGILLMSVEKRITKEKDIRVRDSLNSQNIRGQFWDLFADQYSKTTKLQSQIDSIKIILKK